MSKVGEILISQYDLEIFCIYKYTTVVSQQEGTM